MKGTLAELSEALSKRGFSYQYKAGQPSYSVTGRALYRNPEGVEKLLKRVGRGKPAVWTGAKVGLIKTAQTPDTWAVFKRKVK